MVPSPSFITRSCRRTSPTGGGRSVGIVRSRTKAMEFSLVLVAVVVEQSLNLQVLAIFLEQNLSCIRPVSVEHIHNSVKPSRYPIEKFVNQLTNTVIYSSW
jgi:hypothetical protein